MNQFKFFFLVLPFFFYQLGEVWAVESTKQIGGNFQNLNGGPPPGFSPDPLILEVLNSGNQNAIDFLNEKLRFGPEAISDSKFREELRRKLGKSGDMVRTEKAPEGLKQNNLDCETVGKSSATGVDSDFFEAFSKRSAVSEEVLAKRKKEAKEKAYKDLERELERALRKIAEMDCPEPDQMEFPGGNSKGMPKGAMGGAPPMAKGMDFSKVGPRSKSISPELDLEIADLVRRGQEENQDEIEVAMKRKMKSCMSSMKPKGPFPGGPPPGMANAGAPGMNSSSGPSGIPGGQNQLGGMQGMYGGMGGMQGMYGGMAGMQGMYGSMGGMQGMYGSMGGMHGLRFMR